jgi:hypothetical protein
LFLVVFSFHGHAVTRPPGDGIMLKAGGASLSRLRAVIISGLSGKLWLGFNDDCISNAISDNSGTVSVDVTINSSVPLPSTLLLFGPGLLGLAGWRRFRKG